MTTPNSRRGRVKPQYLPDLPGEEWRPAAGFEGYSVSNKGRVRRDGGAYAGAILRLSPSTTAKWNRWPYATVRLPIVPNVYRHIRVHRLVMATFAGPRAEGMEVNHIDGDHWNNALENLEYVTKRENEDHAVRVGIRPKGRRWYEARGLTPPATAA